MTKKKFVIYSPSKNAYTMKTCETYWAKYTPSVEKAQHYCSRGMAELRADNLIYRFPGTHPKDLVVVKIIETKTIVLKKDNK